MTESRFRSPSIWRTTAFRRLVVAEGAAYTVEALLVVMLTLVALDAGAGDAAIVLVAQAIPRAALLPAGGWITDRLGAARVARATGLVRAGTLGGLAVLTLTAGTPSTPTLVVLGAALGVIDGVAYPASFALVPAVVPEERLPAANAVIGGIEGIGDLAGPAVAALLFVVGGASVGFVVIAAVSLVSVLGFVALRRSTGDVRIASGETSGFLAGLRYAWGEPDIRALLVVLAAMSLLLAGPITVGAAVLAEDRFGGSEQLGLLLGAFGAGSLVGLLLATRVARLPVELVTPVGTAGLGAGLVAVGVAPNLPLAMLAAAGMGVVGGLLGVVLVSWLQQRTPAHMRGRVMALVAFAFLALDPVSYAVAGVLLAFGPTVALAVPGIALLGVAGLAAVLNRRS